MITIDIGIITFNRPQKLLYLLERITDLNIDDTFTISKIIIVDNSHDFSISKSSDRIFRNNNKVHLIHEAKAGIPFARNAVVRNSDSDYLVFIDDDEYPDKNWLIEFVRTARELKCDILQGPVIPVFDNEPAIWIKNAHTRKRYYTGYMLNSMATNSLMIKKSVWQEFENPFNINFAMTGGSDSLLGRELISLGYDVIWCDEAIVYEFVPEERLRLRWIMQRHYRGGNNFSLQLRILRAQKWKLFRRLTICIIHISVGLIALPIYLLPIKYRLFPLCKIAEGLGGVAGLLNIKYKEYKRSI